MTCSRYHLFSHGGLHILLDVPTGAVHLLDETAVKVFPFFVQGRDKAVLDSEFPGQAEAHVAWEQLQDLVDRGLLLGPEPQFDRRPGGGQLKAMCLHVAHDCDLRCRYCFASTGSFGGARTLMDLETAKAAVDFLFSSSARVYEMDFFGGEPLLNLDLVEAVAGYARRRAQELGKRINLTLTTNAYSLDPPVRERLVALDLDIILSHDGREEVHDAMRPCPGGRGSYHKITQNILAFIPRLGERHYVRGTYTAHNLDFVEDIRHWLDLGIRRFSMEPVVAPPASSMALKAEDLSRLREQYWQLAELALERPFVFFHFLLDWEHGQCGARRASGCGAGVEYVAVDPAGRIFPCHQFVGEERWQLGDVFSGITATAIRDSFLRVGISDKPECRDCWARYHCGGGCHANAWWANSRLDKPYNLGCELLKIRTEAALYVKVKQALAQYSSEGDTHGKAK
jgi:uncharacterized protein